MVDGATSQPGKDLRLHLERILLGAVMRKWLASGVHSFPLKSPSHFLKACNGTRSELKQK